MNLPEIDLGVFLYFASFIFIAQALLSIILFFLNAKPNIFGFIYVWLQITFNLVLGYFFFAQANAIKPFGRKGGEALADSELEKFVNELKK